MSATKHSTPHSSPLTPHYLITGGCGFIGTAFIKHLVTNNLASHIRVLDNLTVGTRQDLATVCKFIETDLVNLNPQSPSLTPENNHAPIVELIVGDIRDPKSCVQCCQHIDVIIHLAANTGVPASVKNPRLDMECNVTGTFNMLEGARKQNVKRFVFASSGAPAGEVEPPIHEELPAHPVSPYGASKLAGEGYCSAYYNSFGVETVALRFSNVYGPGSTHKSSVVAKFLKQALNDEKLIIYGDGTQTRDFIYIDDLINAMHRAATIYSKFSPYSSLLTPHRKIGGETFQIATSRETSLDELTELILEALDNHGIARPQVEKTETRPGDVKRNFSDTRKAQDVLGWTCEWELHRGIGKTVEWFMGR